MGFGDGVVRDGARVDDRDSAGAGDVGGVARVDEVGRVFVEVDADREGVVGEGAQEAAQAVALAEVLVDDDAVGEAEATTFSRRSPPAAAAASRRACAG